MERKGKDKCYIQASVRGQYQCQICGLHLSTKQRVFTHLNTKHAKSPLKRVYKKYEEYPEIPVPQRTVSRRHTSARHSLDFELDSLVQSIQDTQTSTTMTIGQAEDDSQTNLESLFDQDTHISADDSDDIHNPKNNEIAQEDAILTCEELYEDTSYYAQHSAANVLLNEQFSVASSETDELYHTDSVSSDCATSSDSSECASDSSDFEDSDSLSEDDACQSHQDSMQIDRTGEQYSVLEVQALCVLSCILRHNLSGAAAKDIIYLLSLFYPSYDKSKHLSYENVLSVAEESKCRTVHYCTQCNSVFSEDQNIFTCATNGCHGYRYKGPLSAQLKENCQPNSYFVLADVNKQLAYILQRKDSWQSIQNTKLKIMQNRSPKEITDIIDGQYYRTLCQPGQFLHSLASISAVFNTDGIPLYSSSNVKLWPVFLSINELPAGKRFARDNMVLAAIWQGKSNPPFAQYMCAFGEEMRQLYYDGFQVSPPGVESALTVRLAVLLATMDLQAKGYVLNMTMHNGQFGCCTCEEEGETVQQGKGHAKSYPYRPANQRPEMRNSDDVKYVKGAAATPTNRVKGICGMTGLVVMPWMDVVIGVVPDYMHGVLLGVTKTLLYKFFSSTNSTKPYFLGKHVKKISKRLQGIKPPDYIERIPRDLEKHFSHFKATELQTWLLFYAIPCLNGYLEDVYLHHLSLLCEGIHLLLGDSISEEELQRAESLLDTFYKQFADLYRKGSCGLNVHNIGAHMVFYLRMWGPLWAWSCFPFEDWNAALLQSVHGTKDVTKQCLRVNEIQLKLASVDLSGLVDGDVYSYLSRLKQHGKCWSASNYETKVTVAGCLKNLVDISDEYMQMMLRETGAPNRQSLKEVLRVKLNDQKLYSQEYTRMKNRVCYVVKLKSGNICKVLYYVVNTRNQEIFTVAKKISLHEQSFICETHPCHIIRVEEGDELDFFSVFDIVEKLFFIQVTGISYVAYMPNMVGHSVFK